MNVVIELGRATHTPELKTTNSGKSVVNFTLAVKRPYSADETDFIDFVAWGTQAENFCRFVNKGDIVAVKGHLEKRNYTKNEEKRYKFEVIVDGFDLLPQGKKQEPQEEQIDDNGDLEI